MLMIMVGVNGFEPPTSWSQTKRATNCATPRLNVNRDKPQWCFCQLLNYKRNTVACQGLIVQGDEVLCFTYMLRFVFVKPY